MNKALIKTDKEGYRSPKVIIRVTEKQNEILRSYSEKSGLTLSALCRLALQDFIEARGLYVEK